MRWDLGLQGFGLLVFMSVSFGILAQLFAGRATTRWLWLIASIAYLVAGLFTSEVWFGGAQRDPKDNVDGLSLDGGLLFAPVCGLLSVLVAWFVTRRRRRHPRGPASAREPIGPGDGSPATVA